MGNTNAELADELELVALVGAVPVAFAPSSTAAQLAELNVEARRIYGEYREAAAHIKTDQRLSDGGKRAAEVGRARGHARRVSCLAAMSRR